MSDLQTLVYEPVPSVQGFLTDESFVSMIVGPVGSTKTTAGIMKIAYHAKRMAACRDGVRRSRCMWVRNTKPQLDDTSIPDFLKWFPDGVAGDYAKTERRFILKFDDVECEVIWRPLETSDDVRRVLSTQLSFAVLEECREINADIFEALQGRLGRYPDGSMVPHRRDWGVDDKGNPIQGCVTEDGLPNKHLWAMTNPPDEDTYWEQFMTNPPSNAAIYFQPSGMSAEADWVHLLPSNYYEDLMQGKSESYIDVYIHAQFGKSLSGQPVFKAFSMATHVPDEPVQWARHTTSPLLIGFDCGLNPTAVICQVDYRGRLLVLSSLTSEGMGALRFCQTVLKPHLATRFAGHTFVVIGDPAGQQRAQTDEKTVFDIIRNQGLRVVPARTNALTARISAVDNFLTRMVDGAPLIMFDKEHAAPLIKAMRGKYRYKLNKDGSMPDAPEKSHPWSDLCFAAGTKVLTPAGSKNIEQIVAGDLVITPTGVQKVEAAALVSDNAEVWEWRFSDGAKFVATADHPVYVENKNKFVPLDELQYYDILVGINSEACEQWVSNFAKLAGERFHLKELQQNTAEENAAQRREEEPKELYSTVYGSPKRRLAHITGTRAKSLAAGLYTNMFGRSTTGLPPRGFKYTTSTGMLATTVSKTLDYCRQKNMLDITRWSELAQALLGRKKTSSKPEKPLKNGTLPPRVSSGTAYMESNLGSVGNLVYTLASIAANNTRQKRAQGNEDSVLAHAKAPLGSPVASIMKPAPAPSVAPSSYVTGTLRKRRAVSLVGKKRLAERAAVFTLKVQNEPMYFAEGILVRNCDALQYVCLHADGGFLGGAPVKSKARELKVNRYRYT